MNTKIIRVSDFAEKSLAEIKYSANIIKNGGLVVFPTETVYGLGADATNENAVSLIYEAKGRPSDNPLIIHISSPEEAEKYTYTTPLYFRLAERFMPGPLTVVLRSKKSIPLKTRGGLNTVAVRCPSNKIARMLIAYSETPIAAPSANLSGTPSPTSAKHVIHDMMGRVDVIIDGGDADFGLESTIVKIDGESALTLLRPGKITVEDLLTVADTVNIADSVLDKLADGAVALSPGMKYKHYSPKASVVLIDAEPLEFIKYITSRHEKNIAVISYRENIENIKALAPNIHCYDFGMEADEESQAGLLFSILRDTDDRKFSTVYAPLPKADGIGLALYNRMIRAAAHKIIRLRR